MVSFSTSNKKPWFQTGFIPLAFFVCLLSSTAPFAFRVTDTYGAVKKKKLKLKWFQLSVESNFAFLLVLLYFTPRATLSANQKLNQSRVTSSRLSPFKYTCFHLWPANIFFQGMSRNPTDEMSKMESGEARLFVIEHHFKTGCTRASFPWQVVWQFDLFMHGGWTRNKFSMTLLLIPELDKFRRTHENTKPCQGSLARAHPVWEEMWISPRTALLPVFRNLLVFSRLEAFKTSTFNLARLTS